MTVPLPLPAPQVLPAQLPRGRTRGCCHSQSHGTASSLAAQQNPHLNMGRPVSHIRTRFFKACSALQNKGKFLRRPWFPCRHRTHAFSGQPSTRGAVSQPVSCCSICFAVTRHGPSLLVSCITQGQLLCAKTEALTYQQVRAARAKP